MNEQNRRSNLGLLPTPPSLNHRRKDTGFQIMAIIVSAAIVYAILIAAIICGTFEK